MTVYDRGCVHDRLILLFEGKRHHQKGGRVDSWSRYQHFSLDFHCDTNTMNICVECAYRVYVLFFGQAAGSCRTQPCHRACKVGVASANLRQQSDKLRNKQPSPPFVQCSHPQLGANSNCQKSEHFRHGPRFSQRCSAIDPGKRRAPAAVGSGLISNILSPTPLRMDGKRRR